MPADPGELEVVREGFAANLIKPVKSSFSRPNNQFLKLQSKKDKLVDKLQTLEKLKTTKQMKSSGLLPLYEI